MSSKFSTGRVQSYNPKGNHGFIAGDDGKRYFAPANEVVRGRLPLVAGQRVEFIAWANAKGPRAQQIRILDAAPTVNTSIAKAASPVQVAPSLNAPPPPASGPLTFRPLEKLQVSRAEPSDGEVAEVARTLGAFMGLGPTAPSFSLGSSLVRTPAFREAARELFERAERPRTDQSAPPLTVAVAAQLSAHKVTHDPELTRKLNQLEQVLFAFFKLAVPQARPETHRAMLALFRAAVRGAVFQSLRPRRAERPAANEPAGTRPVPLAPPAGSAHSEAAAKTGTAHPPATSATRSAPEPAAASAGRPAAPPPQPAQAVHARTDAPVTVPSLSHQPAGTVASNGELPAALTLADGIGLRRFEKLGPHLSRVHSLLGALQLARRDFKGASLQFESGARLVQFLEDVRSEAARALDAAKELVAPSAEAAAEHRRALETVEHVLGERTLNELPHSVMDELLRPSGAARVAQLTSAAALTPELVPEWLLLRWFGATTSVAERLGGLLARTEVGNEALAFMTWFATLPGPSRQLLPECSAPAPAAPLLDSLKETLDGLLEQQRDAGQWRARLAALAGLVSEGLLERLEAERTAEHDTLLARTETLLRRIDALEGALGAGAFGELRTAARAWPEGTLPETVEKVELAVEALGPEIARELPSLALLVTLAAKQRATAATSAGAVPSPSATSEAPGVSLAHPLTRVQAERTTSYAAHLVWVPVADQPFGVVRFPARLKLDAPMAREGEWLVEVATDLLSNVPEEWRRQYPTTLPLQVPAGATYKDFTVEVPVSRGNADLIASTRRQLSLNFTLSRGAVRHAASLHWQGLQRELPRYVSPLPTTATKKEMERHPLGVEREFDRLCDLVAQGRKSFRVHGPRRMGKTTVIRALREHFSASTEVYVVESVVASQYRTAAEVWEAVGRRLSDAFNRPVNLGKTLPPPEEAFNAVREAAREKGYSAVYVLIDEAQALFALSGDPQRLGEALKARLESEWAQVSDKRAALLLGLVGQAHLPELMGGNLLGSISDAVTADGIRADDLLKLLRTTQGDIGLQSTTEAREALARQAGNLWILGSLLDRVATTCLGEGRPWFTEEDVERAVQRLVEADDAGTETTLWSYVRDVLNDSDDKNVWRPSETYPVAMAWARVRAMGGELPKLRAEKVEFIHLTLQDWSPAFDIQKQRVEEAFVLLQKQRVLRKDDSFDLPLLERLLLVRANVPEPFAEEVDRRSLNRLGLRRLETPASTEGAESASGGQASVSACTYGGKPAAVRRVRLTDSKAEQRFIREIALLDRLREASGDAVRAAQPHLPRLFATGVDPAVPDVGLVVYEWVTGSALEARQLTATGALLVLQGLARALAALRHCGIVHRDIRPANVLIRQNKGEAVLIDFGLSVAVDEVARTTALAGVVEFLPPEVKERGASAWSHAGDMYSAGRTLKESLAASEARDAELKELLEVMTAAAPESRPMPDEVLQRIENLLAKRHVRQRLQELQQRFADHLSGLAPALREAAAVSTADFVAAQSGMTTMQMRLLHASEFLENLVQAKVRLDFSSVADAIDAGPGRTFLKVLSDRQGLPAGLRPLAECDMAPCVGELRNAAAHPAEATDIIRRAFRLLPSSRRGGRTPDEAGLQPFRAAVEEVADRVATLVSRPEVRRLVRDWVAA